MNKFDYYIPVAILLISVVFSAVCLMVFMSKGKSEYWISRKMKVGVLLLTLTAILHQSCKKESVNINDEDNKNDSLPEVTCYMPYFIDTIKIDTNSIVLNQANMLTGTVNGFENTILTYSITDSASIEIFQKGLLIASDGEFGQRTERFEIYIDESMKTGWYEIHIFTDSLENQTTPYISQILRIINED